MHEILLICSCMATQEGYFAPGDTPPKKNHNPGDIRTSPSRLPRPKDSHGFVVCESDEEGIALLVWEVLYYALLGHTPRTMLEAYCPRTGADGGNNTDTYIKNMSEWSKLDMDKKMWDYLELKNAYLGLPKT